MSVIFHDHPKLKKKKRERGSTIQFQKIQIIIYDNITIVFIYLFLQKKFSF